MAMLNPPRWLQSPVGACLLYGGISIALTFFNKGIFSYYHFKHPVFMIVTQICFSLLFSLAFRALGVITFPIERRHLRGCVVLATVWSVNVVSGIAALQYLSVPMWSTLRRLTTLITMGGEVVMLSKEHSPHIWTAVGIMVAGAFVAGVSDLAFDATGYALVLTNDFATALYLILVSRLCDNKYLGTFGVMFYMNVCALPMMVTYLLYTGEMAEVLAYEQRGNRSFQLVFLLSGMLAFFINMSQIWCTKINSPVTTSVTGQVSKVVTIFAGFFVFTSAKPQTWNNVAGILIGLAGALYYAWLKTPGFGAPAPPAAAAKPADGRGAGRTDGQDEEAPLLGQQEQGEAQGNGAQS